MATSASPICSPSTLKTPKPKRLRPSISSLVAGETTMSSPGAASEKICSSVPSAAGKLEASGAAVVGSSEVVWSSPPQPAISRAPAASTVTVRMIGVRTGGIVGRATNRRLKRLHR